jgi:hypothetical protein
MDLALPGSGKSFKAVTEEDLLAHIAGEDFAILSADPNTYIQYGAQAGAAGGQALPDTYILEYQEGSLHQHYRAADALAPELVQEAFAKYLRGDLSWRSDFRWEKMSREDLSYERSALNSTFTRPGKRSGDRIIWLLISLLWVLVVVGIASNWVPAIAVPGVLSVVLFLVVWAIRVKDRTQRFRNWIVVAFTVFAYLMQAPMYAEHPYEAVGRWIEPFTFKMIFLSGLLWFLLSAWKQTLGSLSALAVSAAFLALLLAGLVAVLFLLREAVDSPFRATVVILLVVVIALLYKISENMKPKA